MMNNGPTIAKLLKSDRPVVSVEFFPPKDESGGGQIMQVAGEIQREIRPDFVSITYGAGGSTRERTLRYARMLQQEHGFEVMPHLTCVGSSRDELKELLAEYAASGFRHIMALRGDPPKGQTSWQPHPDGLAYAIDLVELIRAQHPEMGVGVAGYPEVHPEAASAASDMEFLRRKVAAGGDFVTTQLFYENAQFIEFVDRARAAGITVPIIPGLMPLRSASQVRRFCKHIPAELEAALQQAGDDPQATRSVGIDWTCRQIRGLLDNGIKAFHLYIMNRSGMATEVIRRLRAEGRL